MPIPFEPEFIEQLTARFHIALRKVWVAVENMTDRPGLHREHVFDFTSGLRLLISKDILPPDSTPFIHVSASLSDEEPIELEEFERIVQHAYGLIGGKGKIKFMGITSKGIPHWRVEDAN